MGNVNSINFRSGTSATKSQTDKPDGEAGGSSQIAPSTVSRTSNLGQLARLTINAAKGINPSRFMVKQSTSAAQEKTPTALSDMPVEMIEEITKKDDDALLNLSLTNKSFHRQLEPKATVAGTNARSEADKLHARLARTPSTWEAVRELIDDISKIGLSRFRAPLFAGVIGKFHLERPELLEMLSHIAAKLPNLSVKDRGIVLESLARKIWILTPDRQRAAVRVILAEASPLDDANKVRNAVISMTELLAPDIRKDTLDKVLDAVRSRPAKDSLKTINEVINQSRYLNPAEGEKTYRRALKIAKKLD